MHLPYFSQVRDVILNKSPAIFQDDTGIPFKYFTQDKWSATFYGKYNKPIKLFEVRMQKDLYDAYRKNEVKPLTFSLGYHSGSNNDNMIVYKRK